MFYDFSNLTVDQLHEKITEVTAKIVSASRMASGSVPQLQMVKMALDRELMERSVAQMAKKITPGVVTESDPDFVQTRKSRQESENINSKKKSMAPLTKIRPTARPTTEQ